MVDNAATGSQFRVIFSAHAAIGELMEAYTYDADSPDVGKQWQRKIARHEFASFYFLFMSQSSTCII